MYWNFVRSSPQLGLDTRARSKERQHVNRFSLVVGGRHARRVRLCDRAADTADTGGRERDRPRAHVSAPSGSSLCSRDPLGARLERSAVGFAWLCPVLLRACFYSRFFVKSPPYSLSWAEPFNGNSRASSSRSKLAFTEPHRRR